MKTRTRKSLVSVVGLDIALRRPGICVVSGDPRAKIGAGLFAETSVIRSGEDLRGPERLSVVSNAIWSWLHARSVVKPGTIYVQEGYAFGAQRAHAAGEMGGCIRRMVWESGGNLVVVPPMTLKKFVTGKGAGDKDIMMKHFYKRWGFDVDEDNECDAFGCAVLGLLDISPAIWTAVEQDMLIKKVERYAGKGQVEWAATRVVAKPATKRNRTVHVLT